MKTLTLEQIKNMPIEQLLNLYGQDYRLEEYQPSIKSGCPSCQKNAGINHVNQINQQNQQLPNLEIRSLAATCPITIIQGTTHTLTLAPKTGSLGTTPYTYSWSIDGGPFTTSTTSGVFTHTYSESIGSHTILGRIVDSCTNPGPNTVEYSCVVNLVCVTPVLTMTTLPLTITQNTTTQITLTQTTSGIGPYTYEIWIDNLRIATYPSITTTSYTIAPGISWNALGTHTIYGKMIDSCETGQSAVTATQTVNVVAACPVLDIDMTLA